MRMEELANNMYIKGTDSVERYLLELVRTYFEGNNKASQESRESIIQQAVRRMQDELSLDGMGVTSVILPNGDTRTGAVSITLEDLMGEPWINPKRTAFNVDFGNTSGTACEGDDPRLSDARKPIEHTHQISEIIGLDGILSSISGKISKVDGLSHKHSNLAVLDMITYTGKKPVIDLSFIDTIEDKVSATVDQIRNDINGYRYDADVVIGLINDTIDDIEKKIKDLRDSIEDSDKEYYEESKEYTDNKYDQLKNEFNNTVASFIEKADIAPVIDAMNQPLSLAWTHTERIQNLFSVTDNAISRNGSFSIADALVEIRNRNTSLDRCYVELLVQHKNTSGQTVYSPIPFITFNNGTIEGSLQAYVSDDSITVDYTCKNGTVPSSIEDAAVICNIYSRQDVIL